ncbi:hypothetical protein O181_114430 [Austropuccinia psidii MF-1]|uniref:Uncharacterized protein n=1 Tax=Austropuccinia psidii MF-1 TaxID=1389203 RepID=A0A9Q3PVH2_9BASI|nr:hypothetical protein [Austropuccinia psidii MF-1]
MRCVQQWNNTTSSWINIGGPSHHQGNPIVVAPEVPILLMSKDERLSKLKRNIVVQDDVDTDAKGSDEIDGEELEVTTPIQRRRLHSTSLSPVQVNTTTHEVMRSPNHLNLHLDLCTGPLTLASTTTNGQTL